MLLRLIVYMSHRNDTWDCSRTEMKWNELIPVKYICVLQGGYVLIGVIFLKDMVK